MSKNTLSAVQKTFWKNLLSTDADNRGLNKILERSALGRMVIYQEAYYLRILGALQEDYTELSRLVGERNFRKLVKEYLDAHPSKHYSMRFIGQKMPSFLKKSHWNKKYPWAAELAAFEWIKLDLFDGIDHTTLTKEKLASVGQQDWPQIKFRFVPSLTVLKTKYRVEDSGSWPKSLKIKPQPRTVKVWRKEEEIYYSLMGTNEKKMFDLVNAGKKFSELCEVMMKIKRTDSGRPNSVETVVGVLSKWLDEQVIESLSLN